MQIVRGGRHAAAYERAAGHGRLAAVREQTPRVLRGHADLVEIDWLRGGRHRTVRARWFDSPSYGLAMKGEASSE